MTLIPIFIICPLYLSQCFIYFVKSLFTATLDASQSSSLKQIWKETPVPEITVVWEPGLYNVEHTSFAFKPWLCHLPSLVT